MRPSALKKQPEQPHKDAGQTQKKAGDKLLNNKEQVSKTDVATGPHQKEATVPKTYTKFSSPDQPDHSRL